MASIRGQRNLVQLLAQESEHPIQCHARGLACLVDQMVGEDGVDRLRPIWVGTGRIEFDGLKGVAKGLAQMLEALSPAKRVAVKAEPEDARAILIDACLSRGDLFVRRMQAVLLEERQR